MRSNLSKHWANKGFNSPAKQVSSQTKLKDVPSEIGKSISNGVKAIGNTTVGQAAAKVAGFVAGPAAEEFVNAKYNKPAQGKSAPNKSEGSSGNKKPVQQAKKEVEKIAPKKPIVKKDVKVKPKVDSAKAGKVGDTIQVGEIKMIKKQLG